MKNLKQHISVSQLKELNTGLYDKLDKYIDVPKNIANNAVVEKAIAESLTIGKLIEIVNSNNSLALWHEGFAGWTVSPVADLDDRRWSALELCDALWEALKEVIQ